MDKIAIGIGIVALIFSIMALFYSLTYHYNDSKIKSDIGNLKISMDDFQNSIGDMSQEVGQVKMAQTGIYYTSSDITRIANADYSDDIDKLQREINEIRDCADEKTNYQEFADCIN